MAKSDHNGFSNLSLEFVRVTEVGAIAAAKWIGKGDGKAADQASVDAMREYFNKIDFSGEIVIGEGAKDEAAELYIGEKLGKGGPAVEIAVDPLECTDSVAYGRSNAISVIATGPEGSLYHAADSYMEKIAVGPQAREVIDIEASPEDNIRKVAKALGKDVSEITVGTLERERNQPYVDAARACGARVQLFSDGDVAWGVATCLSTYPIDILMGIGGSAEAVLKAAAMRCLGGELICRWKPKDEKHVARLNAAGIHDFNETFRSTDLAKGEDISFTATGVLTGPLVKGVVVKSDQIFTHSVVMSSNPRTVRFIKTRHLTS